MALYGMSSVKDERLHRLFRDEKVRYLIPDQDTDKWFNMLVLHQNRAKHGDTNYIPEYFIDDMFDLVFWGHEHECRLEPELKTFGGGGDVDVSVDPKRVYITQPGSSVATSMIEGEAKEKKIGLLSIAGKEFRMDEA